jgi:hypothetical protein
MLESGVLHAFFFGTDGCTLELTGVGAGWHPPWSLLFTYLKEPGFVELSIRCLWRSPYHAFSFRHDGSVTRACYPPKGPFAVLHAAVTYQCYSFVWVFQDFAAVW